MPNATDAPKHAPDAGVGRLGAFPPWLERALTTLLGPRPLLEDEERHRAGYVVAISGFMFFAAALCGLWLTVAYGHSPMVTLWDLLLTALSGLIIGSVWVLARWGSHQTAAVMLLTITTIAPLIAVLTSEGPYREGLLSFQVLPLYIASVVLPWRRTALMVVGTLAMALAIPAILPDVTFTDVLIGPFTLLSATALLVLSMAQYRTRVEADRQAAAAERQRLEQRARRLESLGTLAGGVAHDFNNILASIVAFTELAQGGVEQGGQVWEDLATVLEVSGRGRSLVNQVMTYARRREQPREAVQVAQILHQVRHELAGVTPDGIRIELEEPVEEGVVLASPVELHQVFANLCRNAVDAMGTAGTLRLSLHRAPAPSDERGQPMLVLTVQDDGPGMPPEVLDRAFEPFFTTKPPGKGTGLGLAVVRSIVEACEGEVELESSVGEGCRVTVRLPLTEGPYTTQIPTASGVWSRRGQGRLLLVDDDELVLRGTRRLLEEAGYRVEAHLDPRDAARALEHAPFDYDVLITDLAMPSMSGAALARRARELNPALAILVCAGLPEETLLAGLEEGPLLQHLQKPLSREELHQAIQRALTAGK